MEPVLKKNAFTAIKFVFHLVERWWQIVVTPGALFNRILQSNTQRKALTRKIIGSCLIIAYYLRIALGTILAVLLIAIPTIVAIIFDGALGIYTIYMNKKLKEEARIKNIELARRDAERVELVNFSERLIHLSTTDLINSYGWLADKVAAGQLAFGLGKDKNFLNAIFSALNERGVSFDQRAEAQRIHQAERHRLESEYRREAAINAQIRKLNELSTELQKLEQVQAKRKIRLGLGIGFWF